MGWRDVAEDFVRIASTRAGRILVYAAGLVIGLGYFTIRLAMEGRWAGAATCFFLLILPFAIGAFIVRRNRKEALEEARRARSPLNLP